MTYEYKPSQLKDDPELLKIMLKDINTGSDLYKPTNYWINYEKIFLPELQSLGLKDFRRRKNSVLSSFGATDLLPFTLLRRSNSLKNRLMRVIHNFVKLRAKIHRLLKHNEIKYSSFGNYDLDLFFYRQAKSFGEKNGAESIQKFEGSDIGNPEDVFYVNDRLYTSSLLNYYVHYAYCCKFINFNSINTIMEIGSGSGKQVEIIKKLHPHLCFFIFDIPPQLYVCEQYLSALFPDSVISYRQTRDMKSIPELQDGKIYLFEPWQIPEIDNLKCDLFWNSSSFQEMEPNIVLNYLKFVNKCSKFVFLKEVMGGQRITKKGGGGVLKKTTLKHYKEGLEDFKLIDISKAIMIPTLPLIGDKFSFWKRNDP